MADVTPSFEVVREFDGKVVTPEDIQMSLADGMAALLADRVVNAEVEEVFSRRNGKDVELVRDGQGQFVRRTYHWDAVREIERDADADFSTAWHGYNDMFSVAGITLVPSVLVKTGVGKDPVIATEYIGKLGNSDEVKWFPSDAKIQLAEKLGKLLTVSPDFVPAAKGLSLENAFAIHPTTGEVCLVDVDPYLHARRDPIMGERYAKAKVEACLGVYMEKARLCINQWALSIEERTAMASAFARTAAEALQDDTSMDLIGKFSNIHMLGNGIDVEEFGGAL